MDRTTQVKTNFFFVSYYRCISDLHLTPVDESLSETGCVSSFHVHNDLFSIVMARIEEKFLLMAHKTPSGHE